MRPINAPNHDAPPDIAQRPMRLRKTGAAARARSLVGLAVAASLLATAPAASGANERIDRVTVTPKDGRLYVSAALVPGLPSGTDEDLRKGLPKDLYYYLVLKRRQKNWFDEEVVAVTVKYSLKYDLLKQEYVVSVRVPSGTTRTVVRDFAAARDLVSRVDQVPVAEVRQLSRRKTYVVSVKAEMKAPKMPLYLDYFLFFIPFLDVATEWRDSASFRAPNVP
jgi:hypothetical protein